MNHFREITPHTQPRAAPLRTLRAFGHFRRTHSRVLRAFSALFCVIALGTSGFLLTESTWTTWEAFYFTLITISTVGYGDYGLSVAGQRVTSLLLIGGISTATYAAGQFIQTLVSYQLDWKRKMQKRVDALHDHYIICGCGRVGRVIANMLHASEVPFVAIESDSKRAETVRDAGMIILEGSATDDQVLWNAGVGRAKGIVCASDDDTANIVTTLSARELNPGIRIICRANAEDAIHKLRRAGADSVIAPALESGRTIANMLTQPHLAEFLAASNITESGFALNEIVISAASPLIGTTFKEYGASHPNLVFVALKRSGGATTLRPSGDERFNAGDVVIVVGDAETISESLQHAGPACNRTEESAFVTAAAGTLQRKQQHVADALASR